MRVLRLVVFVSALAGCSQTVRQTRVVDRQELAALGSRARVLRTVDAEHTKVAVEYHAGETLPDGRVVRVDSSGRGLVAGGVLFAAGAVLGVAGVALLVTSPQTTPCDSPWFAPPPHQTCTQPSPEAIIGTMMSVLGALAGTAGLVMFAAGSEPRAHARPRATSWHVAPTFERNRFGAAFALSF